MDKATERANCDALLNRLRDLDGFVPDSIADSEKPDFILKVGRKTIGLEATLGVEGEYIRATKQQQIVCRQESIIITNLKDREPRRTNQEIVDEMLDTDGSWRDISMEGMTAWLGKVSKALDSKRTKLNQPDFQLFDENWLLIYDFPFLANDVLARDQASQLLAGLFVKVPTADKDFDTIFIYSGRYLFRWSENKLVLNHKRLE